MEQVTIAGFDVIFPFKPYPLQKTFMNQVFNCLTKKTNGLLESPTGTGKTMSLLCASLAWLEKKGLYPELEPDQNFSNNSQPDSRQRNSNWDAAQELKTTRILYSSRTHMQLSQACKEMKRTYYKRMTGIVIGGRDALCIDNEVSALESTSAKNHACRVKTNSKTCMYYTNYERKITSHEEYSQTSVFDIEELVRLGKKYQICPYYSSRVLKNRSQVIFTPYNYLLDPNTRNALNIEIKGNVIIFDEGHNIEKVCEESMSGELKSTTIAICTKEIRALMQIIRDSLSTTEVTEIEYSNKIKDIDIEGLLRLQEMLLNLEERVDSAMENVEQKLMHGRDWIFSLMDSIGMTFETQATIFNSLNQILDFTAARNVVSKQPLISLFANSIQKVNEFLKIIYPDDFVGSREIFAQYKHEFKQKYRTLTEFEQMQLTDRRSSSFDSDVGKARPWTIYLWCFGPGMALKVLERQGAHSIIITSGTLAPLESFQVELEIPFPVTLQNPHIVDQNQVGICLLNSSFNGIKFDLSYRNRENMEHVREIGQSIVHFLRIIPGGVLLFFPSYSVMKSMFDLWKNRDKDWKIYSSLCMAKKIFFEPRDKVAFKDFIEQFRMCVDAPESKGALFVGVCRGKLSEGLDLADQYCRGVIILGLPFPNVKDPQVIIKKQYLEELNRRELTPSNWYALQMKRALNQAIGRIVRNKDDFGVVIMMDHRFRENVNGFSKWTQKFIRQDSFGDTVKFVQSFFKHHHVNIANDNVFAFASQSISQSPQVKPISVTIDQPVSRVPIIVPKVKTLSGKGYGKTADNTKLALDLVSLYKPGPKEQKKPISQRPLFDVFNRTETSKMPSTSSSSVDESESNFKRHKRQKINVKFRTIQPDVVELSD